MRLNKNDLVENFILGMEENVGSNLYTEIHNNANILVNYDTIIAVKKGELIYVNSQKYSMTTTRNQNLIIRKSKEFGYRVCFCTPEQIYKIAY